MDKKKIEKSKIVVVDKGKNEKVDAWDCCWGSLFAI